MFGINMKEIEYKECHLTIEEYNGKDELFLDSVYKALEKKLLEGYDLLPNVTISHFVTPETNERDCFVETAVAIAPGRAKEIIIGISLLEDVLSGNNRKLIESEFRRLKTDYDCALRQERENGTLPPDGVNVECLLVIVELCKN